MSFILTHMLALPMNMVMVLVLKGIGECMLLHP